MTIKGKKFRLFLAESFAQKAVGLMYRPSIKDNEGMLFKFPFNHEWKIWMLNMKFPIDVIWLDEKFRIVHIERGMQPCSNIFSCKSFSPDKQSRYVLELAAGVAARLKLRHGEPIEGIAAA